MVSKKRSLLKAISWRIGGSSIIILAVLGLTKNVSTSITVGVLDAVVKLVFYYVHERVWNKIKYGRLV